MELCRDLVLHLENQGPVSNRDCPVGYVLGLCPPGTIELEFVSGSEWNKVIGKGRTQALSASDDHVVVLGTELVPGNRRRLKEKFLYRQQCMDRRREPDRLLPRCGEEIRN